MVYSKEASGTVPTVSTTRFDVVFPVRLDLDFDDPFRVDLGKLSRHNNRQYSKSSNKKHTLLTNISNTKNGALTRSIAKR